jgi:hypothetical protein
MVLVFSTCPGCSQLADRTVLFEYHGFSGLLAFQMDSLDDWQKQQLKS